MKVKRIWQIAFGLSFILALITGSQSFAEPKHGGSLTVLHNSHIPHLNNAIRSGTTTGYPATKIFASPVRLDMNYEFQPYLAESWEFSDDKLSLTLKLKEARFHDGQPITSKDVAFSIMTIKAKHPFKTMLEPVEKVETPDARTAIIRLSRRHPALLMALTPPLCPILPEHVYGKGDIRKNPANLNPVGSGPFKVAKFKADEYLVLEKNEDFFIPERPYLDRIIFRIIPDASNRLLAMENQEADVYPEIHNANSILRLQKKSHLTTTPEGFSLIGPLAWLEFNVKKEPFNKKEVRQAIAYALDKNFITKALYRNMSVPATGPIAPGTPFYSDKVAMYDLDIKKANKMLDDAGYPKKADGIRFEMTLDAENHPDLLQQYAKAQLKQVGIKVIERASPDFATWADRTSNGKHDATINVVFNWGDPVIGVHRTYVTSNIKPGAPYSNTSQYSNPEIDNILDEAGGEMDMDKRKALYAKFQEIIVDDCPLIYLTVTPYHLIYNKKVGNPVTSPWGFFQPGDELYVKE